jgi:hypothetical protein
METEEREKQAFDVWMQSQKEFMDTWMKAQKEFWENLTESARKLQEGFAHSACGQAQAGAGNFPSKEAMGMYNSMVETMFNSTKVYADEYIKMQEAWNQTISKQMEMWQRMAANMFEVGRQKEAA